MTLKNLINKILFFVSLFLLCSVFSILKNQTDLDLWHRMAVGKIFSQLGGVLYHDIFSYFPTKSLWVDHEWLSGVVFYNIGQYFGDIGFIVLKTLIFFAILLLVYKTNRMLCPDDKKDRMGWYFLLLIALIPGLGSCLRCQAFTYLFFALWIYMLEKIRQEKERKNNLIWIFPVTLLLWTNLHGGFVMGLSLLVFYSLGSFINKQNYAIYLKILLLCLPFTLINPYGIKYWSYLFEAFTMPRPYISEWQPLTISASSIYEPGFYFFLLFFLCAVCYKILSKSKNINWVAALILLIMLAASIKSNRNVVFFSIASSVFCYKYYVLFWNFITEKFIKNLPEKTLKMLVFTKNAIIFSLIISFSLFVYKTEQPVLKLCYYPVKAVEFIKINKIQGNLLTPFNWGSYALWKLYPQNLVSMDGRYEECYTNKSHMDVMSIVLALKNWKQAFDNYHHDVILLPINGETEKEIRKFKDWKAVYQDKEAIIFVPSDYKRSKWLKPVENKEFYIKTKYNTDINFLVR